MTTTVTDFRKNLFQIVERALNGELVEITYKNQILRLVPSEPVSKLSRLVRRDTLACTPDEFERLLRVQDEEARDLWEEKWRTRL